MNIHSFYDNENTIIINKLMYNDKLFGFAQISQIPLKFPQSVVMQTIFRYVITCVYVANFDLV